MALDNIKIEYQKLPTLWVVFKILKSLKDTFFFTMFLYLLSSFKFTPLSFAHVKWIVFVFSVYKIISVLLRWRYFGYAFDYRGVYVTSGKFTRKHKYIAFENVQGINEITPFFYRLFGMTMLLLNTGVEDEVGSIRLDMLSEDEVERIKKTLVITDPKVSQQGSEGNLSHRKDNLNNLYSKNEYEISNEEILMGSISSFKMVLFFTFLYSIYEKVKSIFSLEFKVDTIFSLFLSTWWMLLLGILVIISSSIIYGIFNTYILYGNLRVISNEFRIYIEKGLLNKTEISIPKNKIQAINIRYSFIQRLVGLVQVKVISANESEDTDVPTSNTLFPFIKKERASHTIEGMLIDFKISKKVTLTPRLSMIPKLVRTSYIWLICPFVIYIIYPSFVFIVTLIASYVLINQIIQGIYNGYSIDNHSFQFRKSSLVTNVYIIPQSKIVELKVSQTLLQRFLNLSSIILITRESPSKTIKVLDIPVGVSRRMLNIFKANI